MNKTVKIQWNLGQFSITSEMTMDEAQQAAAMSLGALYLHQRISEVDKKLGGFTTDIRLAKVGSKGKGPWRKEAYKRGDVPYSKSLAKDLAECFASVAFSESEFPNVAALLPTLKITEYVNEDAVKKAEATKKAEAELHTDCIAFLTKLESSNTLEAWILAKLHWSQATHGEDGEFATGLLEAAKSKMREHRAEKARKEAEEAARKSAEMDAEFMKL